MAWSWKPANLAEHKASLSKHNHSQLLSLYLI